MKILRQIKTETVLEQQLRAEMSAVVPIGSIG